MQYARYVDNSRYLHTYVAYVYIYIIVVFELLFRCFMIHPLKKEHTLPETNSLPSK